MAERPALNKKLLEDFMRFLDRRLIAYRPGKGTYQVLQVRLYRGWGAIYENGHCPEHYTLTQNLVPLVEAFMKTLDK